MAAMGYVTRRELLCAAIGGPALSKRGPTEDERRLREMEAQCLIRAGSGKLPAGFWDAPRPADPEGLVRQALIEERRKGR